MAETSSLTIFAKGLLEPSLLDNAISVNILTGCPLLV